MSRLARAARSLSFWPREALKRWPEQTVVGSTFGLLALSICVYRMAQLNSWSIRPWYRSDYDIVRPEAAIVPLWRVPEDYPPPYETNRNSASASSYKKDYGFKL
ncbi:unnamed protein product [Bursaphelenchus xylophilus]|uniref:(pine wood nematode) hypothetical protein n=1 Tax=Bursaphelenchus xylophilus TaxID=6326 RepID=A0A1I7SDC6_BURXY|nr:unnamed protein product [Bursaphelenchus xylophilus]CAG9130599.1 unnamed protein product [Bursaphelenchus xylophilus]